jgi:1-phosphofructokinase family hexose kinase
MIYTVTLNPALDRTLTVERIAFDEMVRATASRVDPGGKGFNVSRALAALGMESVALGFVGGAPGGLIGRRLNEAGIATDLVPVTGETRTNTVVVEAATARYVKVNEAGPAVGEQEVAALLDRVRGRVQAGDAWVPSGRLPPGAPPDLYAQLVGLVRERGARAFLDASGEPLRLGCAARPYLVKPNVAEAEETWGGRIQGDGDVHRAAAFFLRQGVELVALSLGAGGLLLSSAERAVRAAPPAVEVRNPVGAGDALLAGVVWALERGLGLEEVARWGVAAGTAAALREGVAAGARAEVEVLYEQTGVEEWSRSGE